MATTAVSPLNQARNHAGNPLSASFANMPVSAGSAKGATSVGGESLQAFQTRITQRIAQASIQPSQEQARLHVVLGSLSVLIPLLEVGELMAVPALSPIPMATPWMLGLSVVRAEVLLTIDLNYFVKQAVLGLGLQRAVAHLTESSAKASNRKLVVVAPNVAARLGFIASNIEGSVYLGRGDIQPYDVPSAALDVYPYVKTVWKNRQGEPMIELSLAALLQSPQLNSALAATAQ